MFDWDAAVHGTRSHPPRLQPTTTHHRLARSRWATSSSPPRMRRRPKEWIRALGSFNVLGSPVILGGLSAQEQQPLWATRVEALRQVPLLFEAIKVAKTESGLTWDTAVSVRRVLTQEGRVTIATGTGPTYTELETPTKVHGLVGALCSTRCGRNRRWPSTSLPTRTFTWWPPPSATIYNETAKSAGLAARMVKFIPKKRERRRQSACVSSTEWGTSQNPNSRLEAPRMLQGVWRTFLLFLWPANPGNGKDIPMPVATGETTHTDLVASWRWQGLAALLSPLLRYPCHALNPSGMTSNHF